MTLTIEWLRMQRPRQQSQQRPYSGFIGCGEVRRELLCGAGSCMTVDSALLPITTQLFQHGCCPLRCAKLNARSVQVSNGWWQRTLFRPIVSADARQLVREVRDVRPMQQCTRNLQMLSGDKSMITGVLSSHELPPMSSHEGTGKAAPKLNKLQPPTRSSCP